MQVEHSYKTTLGGSVDQMLRKPLRTEAEYASDVARYREDSNVDDVFLLEIDKQLADDVQNKTRLQERRIRYILKTGAQLERPDQILQAGHRQGRSRPPGELLFSER